QTGVLSMQANYRGSGEWHVDGGAILDMNGGTDRTLNGIYHGTGTGTILLQNGNLIVQDDVTFDFPDALFQWTGGTIGGGGRLHNAAVMNLGGESVKALSVTRLDNQGTINWRDGGAIGLGSAAVVANAGHFNAFNDALLGQTDGTGSFANDGGTFTKFPG